MSRRADGMEPAAPVLPSALATLATPAGTRTRTRGTPLAANEARLALTPRASRVPGMGLSHEVLYAVVMAIAMAATVFLYR